MSNGRRSAKLRSWVLATATAIAALAVWEGTARLGLYNARLVPPPDQVVAEFFRMIQSGEWISDVEASLKRYAVGFIIGVITGILAGFATGRVKAVYDATAPLMNFLRSTPSVALVPLSIVWLGIGEAGKYFVIAWGVFFPVWIATHTGTRNVTRAYEWAARSLGARHIHMLTEVIFPEALPFIVSGVRIGIATGFFALAAAEMAGAYAGVAFRIFFAQQGFHTAEMMVAILTIGALGLIADRLFVALTKRAIPWGRADDASER